MEGRPRQEARITLRTASINCATQLMRREDLESPDDKWTVFFPFQPIHSNMMLFAVVCMSARMRTAPICACCDAAFARITSVDTRRDTVVVRTAASGRCGPDRAGPGRAGSRSNRFVARDGH
jgi:hypothetical protein